MPLLKTSTKAFFKAFNQRPGFPLLEKVHGYFYMRYPYLYIAIANGEHPLSPFVKWWFRVIDHLMPHDQSEITFADTYHGKVIPIETAKQLVSVKEDLQISYPEKVIPYKIARDLILENPDHIVALDCPCRMSRSNPCQPLDVCLIIGEPFSRLVLDHHPHHSRIISPDEAIGILESEEERGHVHHAFFKQAMIGRFYAICNCCSCCCGAIQAYKSGVPMLAKSGYISQIDKMFCIECGECQKNCQFSSIVIKADGYFIDQDLCMGCGICVSHCPQGAIQMIKTSENLDPLALY